MRRVITIAIMIAPILLAIVFGASLLYNDQRIAALTVLLLYVATLVILYVGRPDS